MTRGGRIAVALACAASLLATAPMPADAADITTEWKSGDVRPIAWADDQGRLYTLVTNRGQGQTTQVVIGRDTPNGEADTTWGSLPGNPGFRPFKPVKPSPGTDLNPSIVADNSTGILTTAWSNCAYTATCDRWIARYDAEGTAVGTPVKVANAGPVTGTFDDGSILLGSQWRGPDGSDRGAFAPHEGTIVATTVDTNGRLVFVTSTGTLIRHAPKADPDLTMPLDCPTVGGVETNFGTASGIALGSAPGGGFATACGNTDRTKFVVTRYDSDGEQLWRTTGQRDGYGMISPQRLTVADDGTVWVSGTTGYQSVGPTQYDMVEAFTSAGPDGSVGYLRSKFWIGGYLSGGISDLHRSNGLVVYVDQTTCCHTGSSAYPMASPVHSGVLPFRHPRPSCAVTNLRITEIDGKDVTVVFDPCTGDDAVSQYRISASSGSAPTVVNVGSSTSEITAETTFPGEAGTLSGVSVLPFTDGGTSTAPPAVVRTVPPFTSLAAFAEQQYLDLTGQAAPATVAVAAGQLSSGAVAPSDLFEELFEEGLAGTAVEPVARLYRAYFLRGPDLGGLGYWVRKRRTGVTLSRISSIFAASSEFQRRYGPLTNAQFVAKLYENVFGRSGDPDGLAFWTRRLDTHRNTRGQVVLQFSESSEGKRRAAPQTGTLAATYLMLGRKPTTSEQATWGAVSPSQLRSNAAGQIMRTEEYAVRAG